MLKLIFTVIFILPFERLQAGVYLLFCTLLVSLPMLVGIFFYMMT